jgi:hypothetical protein
MAANGDPKRDTRDNADACTSHASRDNSAEVVGAAHAVALMAVDALGRGHADEARALLRAALVVLDRPLDD